MLGDFPDEKALIFDMDGVLFFSSDCHEEAFREILADCGIKDFLYASIAGMRTDEAFKKIFTENEKALDNNQLKILVEKKRKRALSLLAEKGEIMAGSHDLIAYLRGKYRLVLASSASPQTVELFLRKSGYADAFEFCLDGSTVLKSKPEPDIYHLALERLGLDSKQCVVIEDSVSGVQAALKAKIPVIALVRETPSEGFMGLQLNKMVPQLIDIRQFF
jgi:beta-phosphoglucomutase